MENHISTLYSLRSELTNSYGVTIDRLLFERTLNVRFLRETGRDAYFYNKEVNMHFVDRSALANIYEIETVDFHVTATGRLRKAEEFIRKINYMYDWMQVRINTKGKLVSIENAKELKDRWFRLRNTILNDYKGDVVENVLQEKDKCIADSKSIQSAVSKYFYFGLFSPHIPKRHEENWKNKRLIEFSEYENEKFEEHIVYEKVENNLRTYKINGYALPESETKIDKYEGFISVPENETLPQNAKVTIIFKRDHIINQWIFNLIRYN